MKKLITIFLLLNVAKAQVISITDYGAVQNSKSNMYGVFKKISDTINAREGNTTVIFPAGTYYYKPAGVGIAGQWNVFDLINCHNVTFVGAGTVNIKMMDSVPFGINNQIGSLFRFTNCTDISMYSINTDGNQQKMKLLGNFV